jgi:hypothetical protein
VTGTEQAFESTAITPSRSEAMPQGASEPRGSATTPSGNGSTPSGNGSSPAIADATRHNGAGPALADGATPALGGIRSASTADLVKLASEQVSQLIRDELALARMEMQTKAKRMGLGAGLFGGAGVVVFYGVGALIAGIALLIALALPAWASALIVAGGLFLLAGLFALFGRSEVKRAGTPMPDEAIGSVKADVQTLSQAVKDGRA